VNREGAEVTSAGRAFQTRAPVTEKAWRPTVGSLTAWTHRSSEVEDCWIGSQHRTNALWPTDDFSLLCCCVYRVYVEMLNRRQNRLQLVVFDVDCFVVNENSAESMVQDANNSVSIPGSVWIVRDETSAYWVNVGICGLHFITSQNADLITRRHSWVCISLPCEFLSVHIIVATPPFRRIFGGHFGIVRENMYVKFNSVVKALTILDLLTFSAQNFILVT